jgi:calcineurin-like phosphoesterase family protein
MPENTWQEKREEMAQIKDKKSNLRIVKEGERESKQTPDLPNDFTDGEEWIERKPVTSDELLDVIEDLLSAK